MGRQLNEHGTRRRVQTTTSNVQGPRTFGRGFAANVARADQPTQSGRETRAAADYPIAQAAQDYPAHAGGGVLAGRATEAPGFKNERFDAEIASSRAYSRVLAELRARIDKL